MKRTSRVLCSLTLAMSLCGFAGLSGGAAPAEKLSYSDLVYRMIDLDRLAELPPAGEKTAQASSYDRASRYDEATGKYINWDANGDNAGMVRHEGDISVMAEIEGPGCIWRTWSAQAGDGHVRIFLDGSSTPAVDLPFKDYFNGSTSPFNYPALVHEVAKGLNNYVPIPFNKSCRIEADKGWGNYYQFTYTTYPKGTRLPTFRMDLSMKDTQALEAVNDYLTGHLGEDPRQFLPRKDRPESRLLRWAGTPGKDTVVADLKGAQLITSLKVILPDMEPEKASAFLRDAVLSINFDGGLAPEVLAPLGDFFGGGPGLNSYLSLPMGISGDTLYSFWAMPFTRRAEVKLSSSLADAPQIHVEITSRPLRAEEAGSALFHAKWHRDAFLPSEPERAIDWTMLRTQGRGRFVGTALEIWNPRGAWWGEGDEKFFVDGEKFPSTFGTGSEDYFGYAWCTPELFHNAFHNQTRNDGDNTGHVAVNRWQIADSVAFHTSLEAAIEKYFANDRPTLYANTVYWYLDSSGRDPYTSRHLKDRKDWYPAVKIYRENNALEGEQLRVVEHQGTVDTQTMGGFGEDWSNLRQLWWRDNQPGNHLVLALPAVTAGRYNIVAALTRAPDYGIVQFSINAQPLGGPVDLYGPRVVSTGALLLGTAELREGDNRLSVEMIGSNPSAVKNYMAGIDYVKLIRVD
ncbi:MAG: DUF2961 domain-containing protein [Armatimonadetes bacterium]|nr:DUF2961 domain-containing protein [Armatimonadota bacterium]